MLFMHYVYILQMEVLMLILRNAYFIVLKILKGGVENFGIKYYRTDIDGSIKIMSDGANYQLISNY